MPPVPKLRVARPTDDLKAVIRFYRDGLGLALLYRFKDQNGFDGVMLGEARARYQTEFTRAWRHVAGRARTQDNLKAFYLPDETVQKAAVQQISQVGYVPTSSLNPYWDQRDVSFEEPDGSRLAPKTKTEKGTR